MYANKAVNHGGSIFINSANFITINNITGTNNQA